jgi:S1-C subfamily serine protease
LRDGTYRRVRVRLSLSPEERALEEAERLRTPRELGGRLMRGRAPFLDPDITELAGLGLKDPPSGWIRSADLSVAQGAVVVGVRPDSPALDAGILPGDWILEINQQILSRAADAPRIKPRVLPGESPSGEYLIGLRRGGPEGERIYRVLRLD